MRITLLIILGFLVIAGTGFYFLMRSISDDVERQYSQAAEEPLVDISHILASLIEQDIRDGAIDPSRFREAFAGAYRREFNARIYNLEKTDLFTHVYVTDESGIAIFDSTGQHEGEDLSEWRDVGLTMMGKYGARSTRTDPEDSRSTIFHVAAPVTWKGKIVGVLTVSRPENAMASFAEETRRKILHFSLIAGGVVVFLGALWTYAVLSPIGKLTAYANRVKTGERTAVPETGRAEIRDLSRALEEMRRELEGKHYVENYVQALTHELKSPLSAIRGAAELIDENMPPEKRARFLENIRAETERSEDVVRRLVQLASLESQTSLEKTERFDLAAAIREEIESAGPLVDSKGVTIDGAGLDEPCEFEGDPLSLRIAIRNLLTNAIDFSPAGGIVGIRLDTSVVDSVRLEIADSGPGIPDYAQDRVFDRFYSLKHSVTGRKGSGLGLCFVREAVELHGGAVSLDQPNPQGTRAVIELPRIG